jgi:hypothetical protein
VATTPIRDFKDAFYTLAVGKCSANISTKIKMQTERNPTQFSAAN